MIRRCLVVLAAVSCLLALSLQAKGGSSKGAHAKPSSGGTHTSKHSTSAAPRTANGRIKRSVAAKHQFEVQTG